MQDRDLELQFLASGTLVGGVDQLQEAGHTSPALDSAFGKSGFVVVEDTSRDLGHFHWMRRPLLRQRWLNAEKTVMMRGKEERRTGFNELFLDLAYVVVFAVLGHKLRLRSTVSLNAFSQLAVLITIWKRVTLYLNRHDAGDGLHKLFYLVLMCGLVGMGACAQNDLPCFGLAAIWSHASVVLMQALASVFLPQVRVSALVDLLLGTLPFVSLALASALVEDALTRQWLWLALAVHSLVEPYTVGLVLSRSRHGIPVSIEHLVERLGLLMVIILGEGVVAALFEAQEELVALQFLAAFLALLLTFSIQWLYFDVVSGNHAIPIKTHAVRYKSHLGALWLFLHPFLFLAFVTLSSGLYNVVHSFQDADTAHHRALAAVVNATSNSTAGGFPTEQDQFSAWMLCGGLAASMLFVAVIGELHERGDSRGVRIPFFARRALRAAAIVFLAVIPTFLHDLLHVLAVAAPTVFVVCVVELEHRPLSHSIRRRLSRRASSAARVDSETRAALEVLPPEVRKEMHGKTLKLLPRTNSRNVLS